MIYLDTEGVGFHGVTVLLQYAQDDGEIKLWNVWKEPIGETLELLEWIAEQEVCMFNAAFDWFHISKIYTMFLEFNNPDAIPEDHIDALAVCEEKARFLDFCIKPKSTIDIMLHARKGPYQSLMKRKAIRVKRIPNLLCEAVRNELEERVHLDNIYFAKRKDPNATQWQIKEAKDKDGEIDPDFKDIVLTFHASGQLKELARHALGVKEDLILKFTDIQPHEHWKPVELGYAPFAMAIGKPGNWKGSWPEVIRHYISHWFYNPLAKKYAEDDVVYTRDLYKHFGAPPPGDDDSELASMVGAARWRGFKVDLKKIAKQRAELIVKTGKTPTAPKQARLYIEEKMDDTEKIALHDGTAAIILESIAGKENKDGVWEYVWINEDGTPHPAAIRAREVLQARRNNKERENWDKLLLARHFHASFKVIGTLSTRMSGDNKLNPQGIKNKKNVRDCFPLADFDRGFVLSGGDFVSFEVVLMEAVYNDPRLREDLLKVVVCPDCNGKGCEDCKNTGEVRQSIHGLFAVELFDIDYDTIMGSKGTSNFYTDGKRGIFSQSYGGNEHTIANKLGIDLEIATKASEGFMDRYPGIRKARERTQERFCSMRQPGGIGSKVEWHEPADYEESLLGFRRYFTLENTICKVLFDIAEKPPKSWKNVRIKVRRRDRLQTASGAAQSALFAAAFNIQANSMRQAANHRIQSSGAGITKAVQRSIWNLQPGGVGPWRVRTMNVHDEIHTVTRPEYVDRVAEAVAVKVESYREQVPLIEIEWSKKERSWADK